jgi:O-antigen/teichoic acid export membrane protein
MQEENPLVSIMVITYNSSKFVLETLESAKHLAIKTINQQADIALLILAPIVTVFLVYINWNIVLLYSTEFTAVNAMIYWTALGIFFRSPAWALVYMIMAKGKSKLYFWTELTANTYTLVLNLIGY